MDPKKVPSPCYVIDEGMLISNLRLLKKVQEESDCKIILALKGFAMWSTFPLIKKYLVGTTASSRHYVGRRLAICSLNDRRREDIP